MNNGLDSDAGWNETNFKVLIGKQTNQQKQTANGFSLQRKGFFLQFYFI